MINAFRSWVFRAFAFKALFGTPPYHGPYTAEFSVGFSSGPDYCEYSELTDFAAAFSSGPDYCTAGDSIQ